MANEDVLDDIAERHGPEMAARVARAGTDALNMATEQADALYDDEPNPDEDLQRLAESEDDTVPMSEVNAIASQYGEIPTGAKVDAQGTPIPPSKYEQTGNAVMSANVEAQAAIRRQADAVYRSANLTQQEADAKIEILKRTEKDIVDRQAKYAQVQDKIDTARTELIQKQQDQIQQYSDTKIDPNRYWNSLSTERQILMAVAVGLGTNATGENKALDMINKAIDKDLDLQKLEMQQRKDTFTMRSSVLEDIARQYDDMSQAEETFRAAAMVRVKNQISEIANQYAGPKAQASAQRLIGQIEQRAAQSMTKVNNKQDDSLLNQYARGEKVIYPTKDEQLKFSINDPRGQNFASTGKPQTEGEAIKMNLDEQGFLGVATMAASAKDVLDMKSRLNDVSVATSMLEEMAGLARSGVNMPTADRNKFTQLKALLGGKLRLDIIGPGTLQPAERAIIDGAIGDPESFFGFDNRAIERINTLSSMLKKGTVNGLGQIGIKRTPDWLKTSDQQIRNVSNSAE